MSHSELRVVIFTCNWNAHESLQEAGKQFRMMIYPGGSHGIGGAKVRYHLFEMITEFFEETLYRSQVFDLITAF